MPDTTPPAPSRRSPVVAVMSTLAAMQVLVSGAALGDVVGAKVAALLVLMVAAAQVGLQFYVRSQVTPWQTVAAQRVEDGSLVAGPAAVDAPAGAPVEEPAPTVDPAKTSRRRKA
jgi:hypothetical protein